MTQLDSIPLVTLLDWLEGRLPPAEAEAVADRLQTADPETRATLDWLRRYLQASETLVLTAPPEAVRRRLTEQFAAYIQSQGRRLFRRLAASLTFDSWAQPGLVGIRTAADSGSERQLIYSTAVADVTLNLQSRMDNRIDLLGQVFPHAADLGVYSIQLLHDEKEVAITTTDELGEFTFPAILADNFDMVVSDEHAELLLSSIDLRA